MTFRQVGVASSTQSRSKQLTSWLRLVRRTPPCGSCGRYAKFDRASVIEAVAGSLAAAGRWDEAIELIKEIDIEPELGSSSVELTSADPLLRGASPAERGWYYVAAALADAGEYERALRIARQIEDVRTRCVALATIALHQVRDKHRAAARSALTEHDRDLRVNAGQAGRMVAIPAATRLIVNARAWPAWQGMAEIVQAGMGLFAWNPTTTLIEGLLDDGQRVLARQVIDQLTPENRAWHVGQVD